MAVKNSRPDPPMATKREEQRAGLKKAFAISPKTVTLLYSAGYKDYRALQHATPNKLLAQFAKQPGMKDKKLIEGYRRAVRRMVWLATQDDPETRAKTCQNWTIKGLRARGAWVDDFDDLTGREVEDRFGEQLCDL